MKNTPKVSGLKILIAEDDEVSAMLLTIILKEYHEEIFRAKTGIEAVDICRIEPDIDLILMDIQMPEMDGNELTKYIRNHMGAKSNVPIIALTAHATLKEEKRCMENGMNDYLSKPFHFKVLLEKLYNNLMNTNTTVSSDSAIQTIKAEKLIDFKYLNEFADGDADFVKEMLLLFIQNSPITLQIILESNEADDINILKSEVHNLSLLSVC